MLLLVCSFDSFCLLSYRKNHGLRELNVDIRDSVLFGPSPAKPASKSKTYKGSCHCGAIEWTAKLEKAEHVLCHCSTCQKLGGGPYSLNAIISSVPLPIRPLASFPNLFSNNNTRTISTSKKAHQKFTHTKVRAANQSIVSIVAIAQVIFIIGKRCWRARLLFGQFFWKEARGGVLVGKFLGRGGWGGCELLFFFLVLEGRGLRGEIC